jgi:hypothetical protein
LPHIREDGFHFGLTPHLASLLMDDRTSGEDYQPPWLESNAPVAAFLKNQTLPLFLACIFLLL